MILCVLVLLGAGMLHGLQANAQLVVVGYDEENSIFAGPQIIHVIINAKSETSEPAGEPTVSLNSADLRMVQSTDGRWHAYFAHVGAAMAADGTAQTGLGLDFGTICKSDTDANALLSFVTGTEQDYFDGTNGVAFPLGGQCDEQYGSENQAMAVLQSPRSANLQFGIGQSIDATNPTNVAPMVWPFVQLYNIGNNAVIEYENQRIMLEYVDAKEHSMLVFDRQEYPPGAHVHAEIKGPALNVDPTSADSWTWDIGGEQSIAIYRAFDIRGNPTGNTVDISGSLGAIGCQDACLLEADAHGGAIVAVDNDNGMASLGGVGNSLVTFRETGSSTNTFVSFDHGSMSAIMSFADAPRGSIANLTYVRHQSIVVSSFDAALGIGEGPWPSGTSAPITVQDQDANRNSKHREEIRVADPLAIVPTIITGSPLTLRDAKLVALDNNGNQLEGTLEIDEHGARAIYTASDSFTGILVDYGNAITRLDVSGNVDVLLNYDMRALGLSPIDIYASQGSGIADRTLVPIMLNADAQGLIEITGNSLDTLLQGGQIEFSLDKERIGGETLAFAADIVSFGTSIDGQSIANQIVRLELKETGADTAIFVGTLEYMLAGHGGPRRGHSDLATISHSATMIAPDRGEVRLDYLDNMADGSERVVSGTRPLGSHTGKVFFDKDEYFTRDTITVTLDDPDLNTSSMTIESYPVGGSDDSLLVLTLDGIVWETHVGCNAPGPELYLTETSVSSGVFVGELRIPALWCDGESSTPRKTVGSKIGITYADAAENGIPGGQTTFEPGRDRGQTIPETDTHELKPFKVSVRDIDTWGKSMIEVLLYSETSETFELIVQVLKPDGMVEKIIVQQVTGQGNVLVYTGPVIDINERMLEVFVWSANGEALAEPYRDTQPK